jgi:hypothetical protein
MSWAVAVCLARTRVMAARERQRDRQLPAGGTAGGKARRPGSSGVVRWLVAAPAVAGRLAWANRASRTPAVLRRPVPIPCPDDFHGT